jgi:hypothetical protein
LASSAERAYNRSFFSVKRLFSKKFFNIFEANRPAEGAALLKGSLLRVNRLFQRILFSQNPLKSALDPVARFAAKPC